MSSVEEKVTEEVDDSKVGEATQDHDEEAATSTGVNREGKESLHEGWMKKKGDRGRVKLWRKRYFRLYEDEGIISYFKSDKDFEELGAISLQSGCAVGKTEGGKAGQFELAMRSSARVWYLQAATDEEAQVWIDHILRFMNQYEPKPVEVSRELPVAIPVDETHQDMEPVDATLTVRHDAPESFGVPQREKQDGDAAVFLFGSRAAFVQEVRQVEFSDGGEDGDKQGQVGDLPVGLQPSTVHARSLSDPMAFVSEQTYLRKEATLPEFALQKLVGRKLKCSVPRQASFPEQAEFSGKLCYDSGTGQFALVDGASVHFLCTRDAMSIEDADGTDLPEPLFNEATLQWRLAGSSQSSHLIEFSYAVSADQLQWQPVYNVLLNAQETEMQFSGLVRVRNGSGRSFTNAKLVLCNAPSSGKDKDRDDAEFEAGSQNVQSAGGGTAATASSAAADEDGEGEGANEGGLLSKMKGVFGGAKAIASKAAAKLGFSDSEHEFRRLYVRSLPAVTLPDGTTKDFNLVRADNVEVESLHLISFNFPRFQRKPVFDSSHGAKLTPAVNTAIRFVNKGPGLDTDLPAGQVNVFRREKDNFGVERLTKTKLPALASGHSATLVLEPLSGIHVTREQTGFNFDPSRAMIIESFEVNIHNHRQERITVALEEALYRWQTWEISASTHPFENSTTSDRHVRWTFELGGAMDASVVQHVKLAFSVFYSDMVIDKSEIAEMEANPEGKAGSGKDVLMKAPYSSATTTGGQAGAGRRRNTKSRKQTLN